jgi:hypothetical protein
MFILTTMINHNLVNSFLAIKNGDWNLDKFEEWVLKIKNDEFILGYKTARMDAQDEIPLDHELEKD